MSICRFNHVFAILFGAALIASMTSVLAEVAISNSSPDLTDLPFNVNCSISPVIKPDSCISDNRSIKADVLDLPLSFIENQGQLTEQVRFMVQTGREMVLFAPSEVVFRLSRDNNTSTVRMTFENSYPGEIIGEGELSGRANFFIGNDSSQWISDIPTYEAIRYKNLYPGVDLVFKGTGGYLKHELIVAPDADPSQIVMAYSGQDNLSLTEDGSVLVMTSAGRLTDSVPVCYQEIDDRREMIEGSYHLIGESGVGFEIGSYDRKHPLVIDPALAFSTYLGGSGDDSGLSIAVDSAGNVYVAGYSASANFPIKNPIQPSNASSFDAFVTKINPSGQELVYSTYLGGGGDDYARGIAVDGSGNAYVTGYTASANFPTKNPLQASKGASDDAFVAKINPAGSALVYSTYLGGSGSDYGEGIALDSSGNAYITGYTGPGSFPTKNPIQGSNAGLWDAFVSKINSAGSALVYSTYLGGSGFDYGQGIAVDSSGNAYITGSTYSTNFPTKNPLQASNKGGMDAFVSKINSAGSALVYSTYLGGSFNDFAEGIAVDTSNNAYITGYTISNNFPTQKPIQASSAGSFDAFVTKINAAGTALVYSTYLGGSGDDFAHGIAVDSRSNACVTGETSSLGFPVLNPIQGFNAGSSDIFVTKINASGSALDFSTYIGGINYDYAKGIVFDRKSDAYLTGYTESANFPTNKPLQSINAGSKDGFVAKLDLSELITNNPPSVPSIPLGPGNGFVRGTYSYSTYAFDPDGDPVRYNFDWGDGSATTTDLFNSGATASASHSWSKAGSYRIRAMATDGVGASSGWSNPLVVTITESISDCFGIYKGNGAWQVDYNCNAIWDGDIIDRAYVFGIGLIGALPVTGDWNGDGKDEIAVFWPATGTWYLDYNGNGDWDGDIIDRAYVFGIGLNGALPVAGDWNGDGKDEIAVFWPVTGTWYLDYNGNGDWDGTGIDRAYVFGIGLTGAIPDAGDWNGDGKDEIAIFWPATGTWYLDYNGNGDWDGDIIDRAYVFGIGLTGALPVAGDWNGDGKDEIAVFWPAISTWYLDYNGNGAWDGDIIDRAYVFGSPSDKPVAGRW